MTSENAFFIHEFKFNISLKSNFALPQLIILVSLGKIILNISSVRLFKSCIYLPTGGGDIQGTTTHPPEQKGHLTDSCCGDQGEMCG